jgi:hypothetical protein
MRGSAGSGDRGRTGRNAGRRCAARAPPGPSGSGRTDRDPWSPTRLPPAQGRTDRGERSSGAPGRGAGVRFEKKGHAGINQRAVQVRIHERRRRACETSKAFETSETSRRTTRSASRAPTAPRPWAVRPGAHPGGFPPLADRLASPRGALGRRACHPRGSRPLVAALFLLGERRHRLPSPLRPPGLPHRPRQRAEARGSGRTGPRVTATRSAAPPPDRASTRGAPTTTRQPG